MDAPIARVRRPTDGGLMLRPAPRSTARDGHSPMLWPTALRVKAPLGAAFSPNALGCAGSTHVAQGGLDLSAVADAGRMATEPSQVFRILARQLSDRPAVVAPEVQDVWASIGSGCWRTGGPVGRNDSGC